MQTVFLIPYGMRDGALVHISEVERGEACRCSCPACDEPLVARKGNIKQHHFSHRSGSDCSAETALHHLGKQFLCKRISASINSGDPIKIHWSCQKCLDEHQGNLMKKAVSFKTEFSFGTCRPDITLFNSEGKPVVFIEVVVTHSPDENVLKYAQDHNIYIVQFRLKSAQDLETLKISEVLYPSSVDACSRPKCKQCGKPMSITHMYVYEVPCWKCNRTVTVASAKVDNIGIDPESFSDKLISEAKESGVFLSNNYIKSVKKSYISNSCPRCKSNIGMLYQYSDQITEQNLKYSGYGCWECDYGFD